MEDIGSYRLAVVILAVLNGFVGFLIVITGHFMAKENWDYTSKGTFCLPCSDVLGHPDDGMPHWIKTHDNNTNCCVKKESHLADLVRAYTHVWQDRKLHEENPKLARCRISNDTKPLLKFHLSDEQELSNPMELHWEQDLERSSTGHMEYADGYVTVHKTGLYHIYSQVSFQFVEGVTKYPQLPKQHIIGFRHVGSSEGEYRYIAKGSNTHCQFTSQNGEHRHNGTSFIKTVYRLHNGDKVSIRVHDRAEILPHKHMNFFGIHMV